MRELMEYRTSLINRLVSATDEFCLACRASKDPWMPLGEGEWNIHQIAAHVRDVDKLVYGLRVRRTASEDNPEFQSFDGELHMDEHYSTSEPLDQILDELRASVLALANMLRGIPTEAWSRESRHATLGRGFTLQTWVERDLAHIKEHTETLKRDSHGAAAP